MSPPATLASSQQLVEFLAALSAVPDALTATRVAVERAARVLEAEVAAVLQEGEVVSSVGYPAGRVPVAELADVALECRGRLAVPGAGICWAVAAPMLDPAPGHLLVARSGEEGFTLDEVALVRGMARVLELTVERLYTMAAERRQADQNLRLLASLRERHRLLEQLAEIQRLITRRAPLQQILDAITSGARDLLGDEVGGLRTVDQDDARMLLLVSVHGMREEVARQIWRVSIPEAGATGQAVLRDELVVMQPYATSPYQVPELTAERIQAAMAAPVHENRRVVGGLVVASYRPDRVYTEADQDVLQVFAEQVSLALTDARMQEAMYQAFHDSLTKLASRALFLERLEYALARAARQQSRLAVLFVDLDRFKMVNDSLGHSAGDVLLLGVADRLRSCLRATDTAARLGGDEFAVVLPDVGDDAAVAVAVATRVIEVLQPPFAIHGKEVYVSASVGIAFNTDDNDDAEALVRNADLAMYEAKMNGRGRYEIFQPAMQTALLRRLELEADLRRAIDRREFVLQYQPMVDLRDGRVVGVEALVRWRHPERDVILPDKFVPLAEETGLILPIGRWVLTEACRQVGAWNAGRSSPLSVGVNLSARQIEQADLPTIVTDILAESGLEPGCLVLEITESLLLRDTQAVMSRLQDLRALGVRLAIDDFGVGYSSLAYLRRFPVDMIKVDKSFVDKIASGPEASALAHAIVQLGRTLRLATLAEGIEAADQLGELRESGCELGQGYYFAKPLDAHEIEALLLGD